MIASRSDIQKQLWTILAGLITFFLFAVVSATPAFASATGVSSTVSLGFFAELATESLVVQQQTRRRVGTSRPSTSSPSRGTSSRTRTAPAPSRSSSPGATSSRRRTNTDSYRGGGRHHRGGGHGGYYYRGYSHYYPYYYPYYSYPFYSSFYWWGAPVYYGYRVAEDYGRAAGALDLDVRPEEAEVWVDGEYIGIADNYDGFPRYLWLPEGDHRLVFYLDGYRTTAREFTVSDGVVLQVKTKLDEGESKPAAEFFPKSTKRAEARQEADEERRAPWRYEDREREQGDRKPAARDADEAERWRTERSDRPENWRERTDLRSEPARLILTVTPTDAVVYLDGRLLGSGEELARLHSALLIDAGEHILEVTRPGYESEEREFDADAGEDVELEIELDDD